MVDAELLKILVCPEDKTPVRVADEATLKILNMKIREGKASTRSGHKVTEEVTEGLVRKDGKYLYPIRDDIPVMLIDEAIQIRTSAE